MHGLNKMSQCIVGERLQLGQKSNAQDFVGTLEVISLDLENLEGLAPARS